MGIADRRQRQVSRNFADVMIDQDILADIRRARCVEAIAVRGRLGVACPGQRGDDRVMGRGGGGRLAVAYIGAASHFAAHETAFVDRRIGATDGANGHANVKGQIALRWQFRPGGQGAIIDRAFNRIGEAQIKRAFARGEIRKPICHGDNL